MNRVLVLKEADETFIPRVTANPRQAFRDEEFDALKKINVKKFWQCLFILSLSTFSRFPTSLTQFQSGSK